MKTLKNLFAINSETKKAAEKLHDKFKELLKNILNNPYRFQTYKYI